jgi:DNA-binding NarL/FixJ family response regulator
MSLALQPKITIHPDGEEFTAAEAQVAWLLLTGMSNKEIAQRLGKAEPTIKNQVASVLRKSGQPSRCRYIVSVLTRN